MAFRIASSPDHGARVSGPPEKWRPRALTVREKLEIVVRQGGKEPSGARLNPLDGVQFDHQPPIQLRQWDEAKQDTIPPSCDLNHIVALNKPAHATKTAKVDQPAIAKLKRLEGRTGQTRRKKKIPSRPFPKAKRRLRA
ncbi:hypothetical protein [Chelativorans sp. AA-79]|uniref:hypothetical protein n=1 Tax=Chelativorans sp. AA-79 TaxID=3028735 RepID=UPI0023F6E1F6|nr:hypothetical protein [Chelativorans sp. AA-79]WEX10334.1 hypothetical protein PVE73_05070 [Chelativorans sp. AA-79]